MKLNKLTLFCLFLFMGSMAFAQTDNDAMLKKRCTEKVKQMCDYIGYMVDPHQKSNNRLYYRKAALNLFIGQGNSYEEDGQEKKGVYMEVTTTNSRIKRKPLMRDYFSNLITRINYSKVVMQTTKTIDMKVSELKPIDDNTYVCTVYFEQTFLGYMDGRIVYGDKTKKRIVCYVKVEQTSDGVEYLVLLGDVTATDTEKIS